MEKFFDSVPEIIKAAAQSELGMLALFAIALAATAHLFFSRASERVKVGIFLLLFLATVSFGVAIFRVDAGFTQKGLPTDLTRIRESDKTRDIRRGARDQDAVFVAADGVVAGTAARTFSEQLRANGFRVVPTRDEAELVVELAAEVTHLGRAPIGENLHSGIVTVGLNAQWADDGATFLQVRREGSGASSSEQNALREALAKAAQLLITQFLDQVDRSAVGSAAARFPAIDNASQ